MLALARRGRAVAEPHLTLTALVLVVLVGLTVQGPRATPPVRADRAMPLVAVSVVRSKQPTLVIRASTMCWVVVEVVDSRQWRGLVVRVVRRAVVEVEPQSLPEQAARAETVSSVSPTRQGSSPGDFKPNSAQS